MQSDPTGTTIISCFQLSPAAFQGEKNFAAPRDEVRIHTFLPRWPNYSEHLTNFRPSLR